MMLQILGIDLRYYQRDILIRCEGTAVIDGHCATLNRYRDEMFTYLAACKEQSYIYRVKGIRSKFPKLDLSMVDKQPFPY
jgi:hypothetical protein